MPSWITYRRGLAVEGKRVLARPNSHGDAAEGIITHVDNKGIKVQYNDVLITYNLFNNGRFSALFETTLDIILIKE